MTRVRTLTYGVWYAMRQRCINPKYSNYRHYGARGITVCTRWDESFSAFIEDMGLQPPGLQIDRIDNAGNYEPGNCRWTTPAENNRNHGRNRNYTLHGETKCLTDWAAQAGMSYQALQNRLTLGWNFEEAINTPILRRASLRRVESEVERENRLLREENTALRRVLTGVKA
jgi:hypothetical protein